MIDGVGGSGRGEEENRKSFQFDCQIHCCGVDQSEDRKTQDQEAWYESCYKNIELEASLA